MHQAEVNKICENIVKRVFEELFSLTLKIEEEIERTDSGVLRTIRVEFKPKTK